MRVSGLEHVMIWSHSWTFAVIPYSLNMTS
jgi:hypothetical protein